MRTSYALFWKKNPFIKCLLATITGIIIQWNYQVPVNLWTVLLISNFLVLICFFWIPAFTRFRLSLISGIPASITFCCLGALLTWQKDIRNQQEWVGHQYEPGDALVVTLSESLSEKKNSLKAEARLISRLHNRTCLPVKGNIIIYFQKDAAVKLQYGSTILFKKPIQEIKNSGNPGGFNYQQYALFHSITHQVYLKKTEFEILPPTHVNRFKQFVFSTNQHILNIIRNNLPGEKEKGLAEALLIGYKDDLDPALVQSYTNTGVVHIIAISGLHLGLIYWLLSLVFQPLKKIRSLKWLRPLIIISSLWIFSFLAGAQPSILRSALMFSCIVLGDCLSKKTSIYNTMAVSAFILLCINPYSLWDVGFQLSYAAVLSIVIFMRPIYNLFYIKNKLLDNIWKVNAVTIAAQLLTVPLSIYYFHQFPNYFMLTNFIAVPLSSIILLGEILLCAVSFFHPLALLIGKTVSWLTWLMNTYIEKIERLPFSLWMDLQISLVQTIFLFLFIAGFACWFLGKLKAGLIAGLTGLLIFVAIRSWSFLALEKQQKIIIYNIPRKRAVDLIYGRQVSFIGDSILSANTPEYRFYIVPSRVLHRLKKINDPRLITRDNYISFRGKHILMLDDKTVLLLPEAKTILDILLISGNSQIDLKPLTTAFDIKQVVVDGSVRFWKANAWKKDCDSLHIKFHNVNNSGAFVMRLR